MKNLTLIIGCIALVLNLLFGYLLSAFEPFNVVFTCVVIVLTTLLIWLLRVVPMKDGFVIGLGFLFLFLGIVEYVLGLNSDPQFTDNGILITAIILVAFETVILLICSSITKRIANGKV